MRTDEFDSWKEQRFNIDISWLSTVFGFSSWAVPFCLKSSDLLPRFLDLRAVPNGLQLAGCPQWVWSSLSHRARQRVRSLLQTRRLFLTLCWISGTLSARPPLVTWQDSIFPTWSASEIAAVNLLQLSFLEWCMCGHRLLLYCYCPQYSLSDLWGHPLQVTQGPLDFNPKN